MARADDRNRRERIEHVDAKCRATDQALRTRATTARPFASFRVSTDLAVDAQQ